MKEKDVTAAAPPRRLEHAPAGAAPPRLPAEAPIEVDLADLLGAIDDALRAEETARRLGDRWALKRALRAKEELARELAASILAAPPARRRPFRSALSRILRRAEENAALRSG